MFKESYTLLSITLMKLDELSYRTLFNIKLLIKSKFIELSCYFILLSIMVEL